MIIEDWLFIDRKFATCSFVMKFLRYFLLISILSFAIGAGFAPWVYRPPVAMQLTAPGLAEYVKFLAENRLGLLPIHRLFYLLPLATAAICLPLLAANRQMKLHWGVNLCLRAATVPLALAILSPVWSPGVLLSSEFRLQTFTAIAAIGLAIVAPFFKKLPLRWLITAAAIAARVSTALALQQFWLENDAIAATYASPVGLGWGGWLTVFGAVGLVFSLRWLWANGAIPRAGGGRHQPAH